MNTILQDIRYSLRGLIQKPGFTAIPFHDAAGMISPIRRTIAKNEAL